MKWANRLFNIRKANPPRGASIVTQSSSSSTKEENDNYCWDCHKEGNMLVCCEVCPRVYHPKCLGLSQEPNASEWVCPGKTFFFIRPKLEGEQRNQRNYFIYSLHLLPGYPFAIFHKSANASRTPSALIVGRPPSPACPWISSTRCCGTPYPE